MSFPLLPQLDFIFGASKVHGGVEVVDLTEKVVPAEYLFVDAMVTVDFVLPVLSLLKVLLSLP